MKPNSRTVPNWALAEAHANAGRVVKRLAEEYAGDSRVEIIAIDNSGDDASQANRVDIDSIPEAPNEREIKAEFDRAAAAAVDAGHIDEGHYQGLIEAKPVRGHDGGSPEEGASREDRHAVTGRQETKPKQLDAQRDGRTGTGRPDMAAATANWSPASGPIRPSDHASTASAKLTTRGCAKLFPLSSVMRPSTATTSTVRPGSETS